MSLYSPKDFLNKGIQIKEGAFVVMVKTEWNSHIIDELEEGCIRVFTSLNIKYQTLIVPGAVEIPFAIKNYWEHHSSSKPDAFIALGCVIRGGTPHFDYVCKFLTEGVLQLNLSIASPTIFAPSVKTSNSNIASFATSANSVAKLIPVFCVGILFPFL